MFILSEITDGMADSDLRELDVGKWSVLCSEEMLLLLSQALDPEKLLERFEEQMGNGDDRVRIPIAFQMREGYWARMELQLMKCDIADTSKDEYGNPIEAGEPREEEDPKRKKFMEWYERQMREGQA